MTILHQRLQHPRRKQGGWIMAYTGAASGGAFTWTSQPEIGIFGDFRRVLYINDEFYIFGSSGSTVVIAKSANKGATWTTVPAPTPNNLGFGDVAHNGTTLLLLQSNGRYVATSTNYGTTWTARYLLDAEPGVGINSVIDILDGGGKFVALCATGLAGAAKILYSTTGLTGSWAAVNIANPGDQFFYFPSFSFGGGAFNIIGANFGGATRYTYNSTDATTWSGGVNGTLPATSVIGGGDRAAAYSTGKYTYIDTEGVVAYYSSDGASWSASGSTGMTSSIFSPYAIMTGFPSVGLTIALHHGEQSLSVDGGATWALQSWGVSGWLVDIAHDGLGNWVGVLDGYTDEVYRGTFS